MSASAARLTILASLLTLSQDPMRCFTILHSPTLKPIAPYSKLYYPMAYYTTLFLCTTDYSTLQKIMPWKRHESACNNHNTTSSKGKHVVVSFCRKERSKRIHRESDTFSVWPLHVVW